MLERMWSKGNTLPLLVGMHMVFSSENWELMYLIDLAIPLLGIYPKGAPSYHKDTCSTMFIAALFVIARNWKQPRCPSSKEYTKKSWYICTMKCYSVV